MKYIILGVFLVTALFSGEISAQTIHGEPFAHTFSIVAIDSASGEMGVAVQSHWFSVGSIVAWARPGVGVVATQSLVNVSFGPRGLELMEKGIAPQNALQTLLGSDKAAGYRQVALLNAKGQIATHTGKECIAEAGHIVGKTFSVQANMMLNKKVVPAMAAAFQKAKGPLAERMIAALEAAQKAGGDIRGQQSAAIKIVKIRPSGKIWEDVVMDLRVEDHPQAVQEIARLVKVYRAYEHMNRGDLAIEKGDKEAALREYSAAEAMFPKNLEMKFWHAVALTNIGQLQQALPLFAQVFSKDGNYRTLARRLIPNGMLKASVDDLKRIMNAGIDLRR
jgi:uncharacterized Ntn-hydrolase superfamily protein